jgi:DNA polymerase-1
VAKNQAVAEPARPLVLIDGHSLAYRAFFALPQDLQTTTGQVTNAVYGFTSMLVKLFGEVETDRIAVCFDLGKPQFRRDIYADYKGNRTESPDEFRSQIPLIREVLDVLRIPLIEVAGYEGEDLIATLAEQARAEGVEVLIVSGDRDCLQLIDDSLPIRVMLNRRGVSDTVIYDEAGVVAKYGVPPSRYVDLAALRGDPSDNLPGVPGVADKTAAKLLAQHDTAEEVVRHAAEQRGKLRQNLLDHGEAVLRNKKIMAIRRDVPMTVTLDDLRMGEWDRPAIHRLFDTLEFQPIRERLFAAVAEPTPDEGFEVQGTALDPGTLGAWLDTVPAGEPIAIAARLDTEPGRAELRTIALRAAPTGSAYLDLAAAEPADLDALRALLADDGRPKVTHDAKQLYLAVWERGWELSGLTIDTALAAYLALPAQRTYDLADLALRYLRKQLRSEADAPPAEAQGTLDLDGDAAEPAGPTEVDEWCLRAEAAGELAVTLTELLDQQDMTRLLGTVELPLVPILARLEQVGIAVDLEVLSEINSRLEARMTEHEDKIYEAAGEKFLINSNPQLQSILFDKLQLPKTKKIKTGYSTDATALQQLASTEHPIIPELLGYREVSKLKSTYIDALPRLVNPKTGRIHAQFNQMIAATGRLSSQNPNVQNIPIRTETGREVRRAFIAAPESEGLLVADYAQIEFRVLAHLVGDEELVQAFLSGEDVHATVAGMVWGLAPDQVDRELRNRVKMVTYGLAYGLSAFGLANNLGIPTDEAKALMEAYFARFGSIREYLTAIVNQARRDGYTSTILGRRRYLPDLTSDNRQRREMAERMALNAPIQGSAADLIKLAMVAVDRAITAEGLASKMILQVHDELVFEVAPGEGDRLAELVRREMDDVYELKVPLEVSMATGRSWAEAQH